MIAHARFWDGIAESYAKKPVANLPVYQRKLAATYEHLRPSDVVLDIGCGTGSLVLDLAPRVSEIHGADLSEGMVAIANRKARAQGADNVTFHTCTVDQLEFAAESFDVICAYNILHLVDDRHRALRTIMGLLRPGGKFISSTPCLGGPWSPIRLLFPVMRLFGKAPSVLRVFKPAQLEEAVREVGFRDLIKPELHAPPRTFFAIATKPA
ncbi:MAG: class I SAM-dependent methyltransferase [Deltaproteobacteria bacterium]|nr:class I SAM-dependent methyltransferase [Deltaproteobacteria bacterium]